MQQIQSTRQQIDKRIYRLVNFVLELNFNLFHFFFIKWCNEFVLISS